MNLPMFLAQAAAPAIDLHRNGHFDLADLLLVGTIIGGMMGGVQMLIKLGDRLWLRKTEKTRDEQSESHNKQPVECALALGEIKHTVGGDHEDIKRMVAAMFAETHVILKQTANNIDRLRDILEMSHQHLERNQEKIISKVESVGEALRR